jgi:uncharacterized protein
MSLDTERLYRPTAFFGLDFILTWGPLWLMVIGRRLGWFAEGFALLAFAGFSATVSAVVFVHLTRRREFIRDFWIRAVDPSRIGLVWWIVILFSQLIINILAILLSPLFGGSLEQLALTEQFLSAPILFLLWTLVFGPIPEELGWRGYGLDALRSRMNLLQASLLLGAIWGIWHLPLVFMEGSFQRELLAVPGAFVGYFAAFFPGSILMSWIYYRTNRSTLSAILFHFAGNAAGEILAMAPETRIIQTVIGVLWKEWPMFTERDFRLELSALPTAAWSEVS